MMAQTGGTRRLCCGWHEKKHNHPVMLCGKEIIGRSIVARVRTVPTKRDRSSKHKDDAFREYDGIATLYWAMVCVYRLILSDERPKKYGVLLFRSSVENGIVTATRSWLNDRRNDGQPLLPVLINDGVFCLARMCCIVNHGTSDRVINPGGSTSLLV
jgi:hypothetical protein